MPQLPDWWESHVAYLESRPARAGLRAVAQAVAPGSRVESARRLGGGIGSATSAIRLRTRSGRPVDVVLKRDRRDNPAREWRRLKFAERLPVPTPEPLALDTKGMWFGVPALVMRRLPGRPDVNPKHIHRWLEEIARMQIQIHAAAISHMPASIRVTGYPDGWKPPEGIRRTALVAEAIAKLRPRLRRALQRDVVIAHGDSHPGNLLWTRGRVSGVTDWQNARIAPRGYEVAYMRADIAVLLGIRASDAYGTTYERLLGKRVDNLAVWDLVCALDALQWSALWVRPYREQGADVTNERARRHALAFARMALSRI